jgi:hypothetical protein
MSGMGHEKQKRVQVGTVPGEWNKPEPFSETNTV